MRIWFMKNKVIKTIIKIYFLIEKAEHNGCLNHTLHPLLCQICLRGKDSNCVLDFHSVYPLEHRELKACAHQVPRDSSPRPSPFHIQMPFVDTYLQAKYPWKGQATGGNILFQGSHYEEPCCLLVELISCLPLGQSSTQAWNLQPVAKRIQMGI